MKLLLKFFLAFCAFRPAASNSFEELASNLEDVLSSQGGACASGSIERILEGSQADCLAFIDILLALDSVNGDAEAAALKLLIGNVNITEESLQHEDKELFVDESNTYDFETKEDEYDIFACEVEEIHDDDNAVVGTRSNPRCIEDRINEAEAIRMQHDFLAQTSGAADSDVSNPSPSPASGTQQDPAATTDAPSSTATSLETSLAPVTEAPGTDAPGTEAPETEAPATAGPGTEAPGIQGYESPIEFLEETLSLGGTCETDSIETIINGGNATCDAFSKVAAALATSNGDFVQAAYMLALDNVDVEEASLPVPKKNFVDENLLYKFSPIEDDYDEYGCEKEDITNIADGLIVGVRSDPDCVFLRVAEIHIVMLVESADPVPLKDVDFAALEAKLSLNGSCVTGSVEIILSGGDANCQALVDVVSALDDHNLNFRHTADALLLERISLTESFDAEKEDLIHDNSDFLFTHEADNFDDLGCHIEDITEVSSGAKVGTRSDPECTLLRVAQIEVALVVERFVIPSTSDNNEPVANSTNSTDTPSDGSGSNNNTETEQPSDDTDIIADEGIPLDMKPTVVGNMSDANVTDEGIPLILPTDLSNESYVPFEVTGYNEKNEIDFGEAQGGDLVCINETIALDKIPEVGHEQDFVSNNRRIQQQVFLINQKLLDYSEVNTDNFESTCAANNGVFRIVNATSLCRRRSIFEDRILQRINYIGRNFPVCAGQQCSDDDNFNLIFAHSLLTGHEFFDNTGEGEFWTCSRAWSMSMSAIVGIVTAAAWFLM